MKKSNYSELMQRYLINQVTDEERAKIEAWLELDKTDSKLDDLTPEEEEDLFKKITDGIAKKEKSNKKPNRWLLRVAAGIALIAAGVTMYLAASSADVDKMVLMDGTLVWLKGESSLTYLEGSNGTRQAQLRGEALFEVAKDSNRPFQITCGQLVITVVGTSFNLKANQDSIELKVLTGKVNVASANDSLNIDLVAKQSIKYSVSTGAVKATISQPEINTITANTEYNMQFSDQPLTDVIRKLEKKFDVMISLESETVGSCRVTADLTDNSLETSLQMITEILRVSYEREGTNQIRMKGEGCN